MGARTCSRLFLSQTWHKSGNPHVDVQLVTNIGQDLSQSLHRVPRMCSRNSGPQSLLNLCSSRGHWINIETPLGELNAHSGNVHARTCARIARGGLRFMVCVSSNWFELLFEAENGSPKRWKRLWSSGRSKQVMQFCSWNDEDTFDWGVGGDIWSEWSYKSFPTSIWGAWIWFWMLWWSKSRWYQHPPSDKWEAKFSCSYLNDSLRLQYKTSTHLRSVFKNTYISPLRDLRGNVC